MPVVANWDGENRRIYLAPGVRSFSPVDDIYREYRAHRRTNEQFRRWAPLLKADGNVPKSGGKFTERFITLLEGTKIVPADETHDLAVTGEILTDDQTPAFDNSSLSPGVTVVVSLTPSNSEVVAGGQLSQNQVDDIVTRIATQIVGIEKLVLSGRATPDGLIQIIDDNDNVTHQAAAFADPDGTTPHTGGPIRRHQPLKPT